MRYHKDKNGVELSYCSVVTDDGYLLDLFGTGSVTPGDGECVWVWSPDGPRCIAESKVRIATPWDHIKAFFGFFKKGM